MNRTVLLLAVALAAPSLAGAAEESAFALVRADLGLSVHDEMFVFPYSWSDEYNGARAEVVFQLSAKHDVLGTRLYFAYSQISFWQAYDRGNSSPFRETNYNPEAFYRFRETPWKGGHIGADVGFEHESNGQVVPLSRSWNLFYATPWYRTDRWLVHVKIRYRVPEEEKETPLSPIGDDNPDITDFLGYGDITVARLFANGHQLRFLMRGFVGTGTGLLSLTYSIPLPSTDGGAFACLRVSNGFGESMIDYDRHISRVGVGIMFTR